MKVIEFAMVACGILASTGSAAVYDRKASLKASTGQQSLKRLLGMIDQALLDLRGYKNMEPDVESGVPDGYKEFMLKQADLADGSERFNTRFLEMTKVSPMAGSDVHAVRTVDDLSAPGGVTMVQSEMVQRMPEAPVVLERKVDSVHIQHQPVGSEKSGPVYHSDDDLVALAAKALEKLPLHNVLAPDHRFRAFSTSASAQEPEPVVVSTVGPAPPVLPKQPEYVAPEMKRVFVEPAVAAEPVPASPREFVAPEFKTCTDCDSEYGAATPAPAAQPEYVNPEMKPECDEQCAKDKEQQQEYVAEHYVAPLLKGDPGNEYLGEPVHVAPKFISPELKGQVQVAAPAASAPEPPKEFMTPEIREASALPVEEAVPVTEVPQEPEYMAPEMKVEYVHTPEEADAEKIQYEAPLYKDDHASIGALEYQSLSGPVEAESQFIPATEISSGVEPRVSESTEVVVSTSA